ncbi:hypothetical protein RIF29_30055 [Crotalaria pallida]|uniref:Uncharacterized protein n=1 Tax=Crotalaria pallida TaxID=3830 RepID=A0AAN9I0Y9_CROPI
MWELGLHTIQRTSSTKWFTATLVQQCRHPLFLLKQWLVWLRALNVCRLLRVNACEIGSTTSDIHKVL